jgi:hypothetical protein
MLLTTITATHVRIYLCCYCSNLISSVLLKPLALPGCSSCSDHCIVVDYHDDHKGEKRWWAPRYLELKKPVINIYEVGRG